jgi:preprotein translocase subunit SecE
MIERSINLVWLLVGLGTIANAWNMGLFGSMGPDSGFFPMICGVIVAFCGLVLLIKPKKNHVEHPDWPKRHALLRILGVIGGLVAMAVTLPLLGFAISAAITTFVLLQTVERSRPVESVIVTVISVGFVMYIFDHLLGMSLPRSPWGW